MRLMLPVYLFLLAFGSSYAAEEPVVVDVCGADELTSTGVTVNHGERWNIEVIGSSPTCKDGKHGDPLGRLKPCDHRDCARWADGTRIDPVPPTGWERWYIRPFNYKKRVRSAHWYELTGAVGSPFKQTFAIGSGKTVPIETDGGELYLFANDAPGRYFNNYGALRVRLTLVK